VRERVIRPALFRAVTARETVRIGSIGVAHPVPLPPGQEPRLRNSGHGANVLK
jgi:hypothetical protein